MHLLSILAAVYRAWRATSLSGLRDPYPDGALGVVKVKKGACAELILVDGNSLEDLGLVAD